MFIGVQLSCLARKYIMLCQFFATVNKNFFYRKKKESFLMKREEGDRMGMFVATVHT